MALIEPLHNHEGNESKGNESTSEYVGSLVVHCFHVIKQSNRHNAGFLWDIATNHEHDTELTDGVGEGHHAGHQKPVPPKGKGDGKEAIYGFGA